MTGNNVAPQWSRRLAAAVTPPGMLEAVGRALAAMEPPPRGGGDWRVPGECEIDGALPQWSRRLAAAVTALTVAGVKEIKRPQWSRRLAAAVTSALTPCVRSPLAQPQWSRRLAAAVTLSIWGGG